MDTASFFFAAFSTYHLSFHELPKVREAIAEEFLTPASTTVFLTNKPRGEGGG